MGRVDYGADAVSGSGAPAPTWRVYFISLSCSPVKGASRFEPRRRICSSRTCRVGGLSAEGRMRAGRVREGRRGGGQGGKCLAGALSNRARQWG